MEASKRDINQEDRHWIEESMGKGVAICEKYLNCQLNEISLEQLDYVFQKWKTDQDVNKPDDEAVASGLGALFGEYVVSQKIGKWIVVTDSYGTDLSVEAFNGTQIYPINAVWKRIDPENLDLSFFEPIYATISL